VCLVVVPLESTTRLPSARNESHCSRPTSTCSRASPGGVGRGTDLPAMNAGQVTQRRASGAGEVHRGWASRRRLRWLRSRSASARSRLFADASSTRCGTQQTRAASGRGAARSVGRICQGTHGGCSRSRLVQTSSGMVVSPRCRLPRSRTPECTARTPSRRSRRGRVPGTSKRVKRERLEQLPSKGMGHPGALRERALDEGARQRVDALDEGRVMILRRGRREDPR